MALRNFFAIYWRLPVVYLSVPFLCSISNSYSYSYPFLSSSINNKCQPSQFPILLIQYLNMLQYKLSHLTPISCSCFCSKPFCLLHVTMKHQWA